MPCTPADSDSRHHPERPAESHSLQQLLPEEQVGLGDMCHGREAAGRPAPSLDKAAASGKHHQLSHYLLVRVLLHRLL